MKLMISDKPGSHNNQSVELYLTVQQIVVAALEKHYPMGLERMKIQHGAGKRFPVLTSSKFRTWMTGLPVSVPWEFVELFRKQAELNHGQTLEQLAERGLSPEEMWLAANGCDLSTIGAQEFDVRALRDWIFHAARGEIKLKFEE